MEAPITIERLFKLGDYKNLKVTTTQDGLDERERFVLMVENVYDVYSQFYIHQVIQSKLNDNDASFWEDKLVKLAQIKHDLLQEG